jgi:hypothetical protein
MTRKPNSRTFCVPLAALTCLLSLPGCAGLNDPYQRAGTWRPEGLNDANIAAMVTRPSDLTQGVNDPVSPAQLSAAAVHRLLTDKVKPLATTQTGNISQTETAPPTAAGAGDSP